MRYGYITSRLILNLKGGSGFIAFQPLKDGFGQCVVGNTVNAAVGFFAHDDVLLDFHVDAFQGEFLHADHDIHIAVLQNSLLHRVYIALIRTQHDLHGVCGIAQRRQRFRKSRAELVHHRGIQAGGLRLGIPADHQLVIRSFGNGGFCGNRGLCRSGNGTVSSGSRCAFSIGFLHPGIDLQTKLGIGDAGNVAGLFTDGDAAHVLHKVRTLRPAAGTGQVAAAGPAQHEVHVAILGDRRARIRYAAFVGTEQNVHGFGLIALAGQVVEQFFLESVNVSLIETGGAFLGIPGDHQITARRGDKDRTEDHTLRLSPNRTFDILVAHKALVGDHRHLVRFSVFPAFLGGPAFKDLVVRRCGFCHHSIVENIHGFTAGEFTVYFQNDLDVSFEHPD